MSKAKQTTGTVSFKKKDAVEIELETPISPAVSQSQPSSYGFDDIIGEESIADAGGYCRIKVMQGTSAEVRDGMKGRSWQSLSADEQAAIRQYALRDSDRPGLPEVLAEGLRPYFSEQRISVRFETEEEVWNYGGSTAFQLEPGKVNSAADL
jgi:hypothetical protein